MREGPAASFEPDPLVKRETLELVRAYCRISRPRARKGPVVLTKAMARISSKDEK